MMSSGMNWDSLGLSNDFLFGKVMQNPEICKEMLETILGIQIERIEYPEVQKSISESKDAKSVRLDVYVADGAETVYNVEIQTSDTRELPKRSRYYQSMIDVELLNRGEPYRNLKRSYVIFICTFDLYKKGRYVYTFENRCKEEPELSMGDQATKIFLNTEGAEGSISAELKAFLDYIGGRNADGGFIRKLDAEVEKAKQNKEWRREYMTLFMRDQENIEKGREEGLAEGLAEGRREGGILTLIDLCKDMGFSREDTRARILQKFTVTSEEAEEYLNKNWK